MSRGSGINAAFMILEFTSLIDKTVESEFLPHGTHTEVVDTAYV